MLDARRFLLALGLTAVLSIPATAQYHINGMMTGLLERPQYRLEIPLTDQQLQRARSATRVANVQFAAVGAEFKDLEGPARTEAVQRRRLEIRLAYERELAALLDPAQMKRLRQIVLYSIGCEAFRLPAVRDELKLTAEQSKEVDAILQRFFESSRTLLGPGRNGDPKERKERGKMSQHLLRITMAEILAVLNDEQKKAWTEMQGPPLRLP